ncbi:hypothetical protein [Roseovarius arcticus]|uniref:hypothetical protein n=1 Tax=Roseovarius arcticus TaxID=2547404 RepID=UPI001110DF6E|nr:hypothetical protein [Roseovarius arcticus]
MIKKFTLVCTLVGASTVPLSAGSNGIALIDGLRDQVTAHSGGCRKNSPPGKCCHAGSKPLHCH